MNFNLMLDCLDKGAEKYLKNINFGLFSLHGKAGRESAENLRKKVKNLRTVYTDVLNRSENDVNKITEFEIAVLEEFKHQLSFRSTLSKFICDEITQNATEENNLIANIGALFGEDKYRDVLNDFKKHYYFMKSSKADRGDCLIALNDLITMAYNLRYQAAGLSKANQNFGTELKEYNGPNT